MPAAPTAPEPPADAAAVAVAAKEDKKGKAEVPFFSFEALRQGVQLVFFGAPGDRPWFNLFLIFVPLAIISENIRPAWPAGATFVLALLAMLPLAERLGFTTEELAEHVNETLAGLMNASMGNAPELIIAIFALKDGLIRVVQVSLLGSILSNLLLVLGTGLLVGGLYNKTQTFKNTTSTTSAGMMLTAMFGLTMPTVLSASNTVVSDSSVLLLSRIASLLMLGLYATYLVFQLKTHQHLFEDPEEEEEVGTTLTSAASAVNVTESVTPAAAKAVVEEDASAPRPRRSSKAPTEEGKEIPASLVAAPSGIVEKTEEVVVEEEEEEEIHLTLYGSLIWLAAITALVAYVSELLVGSIEGASASWGLSSAFISCILLPVAGNAAEHASAIIFAAKNRLDVCFGIAVGSATQIAMFGIPLLVIIGWIWDKPMSLDFEPFEVFTVVLSVIISGFIMLDGRSHYMQGTLLLAAYGIVAAAFGVHKGHHDE